MSESEPAGAPSAAESTPSAAESTPSAAEPTPSAAEPAPSLEWTMPDSAPQAPQGQDMAMAPPTQAQFQQQYQQPFPQPYQHQPQPMPGAPYYGPPLQGYPGQELAPAKKPKRKRALWIVTAVVAVLALAAAGVYALLPGRTGDSVVAKVVCQPTNLTTCLIKAPAGAVELSSTASPGPSPTTSPWPQQATPSADVYATVVGHDSPGVGTDTAALLGTDTLHKIVHTDWNAVDGNNVDLVLLSFGTQKGAQAWNSTRTAEIMAAYRGQAVAIPGDSTAKAYAGTKVDAQGNFNAAYSTVVGTLVLNVSYSSPTQLSAPDLQNWAGTELASIRTAPAAPADPADAAPGTQQVSCAGNLHACLMPMPSGAEHWTSPISKQWISSSTLTQSQFIQLTWDSQYQANVTTSFNEDGVTGIAHTDFDTDNAEKQADIYLIQTLTAAGATQLNTSTFGAQPNWGSGISGISFTLPNDPAAVGWRSNKEDSNGFTDVFVTDVIGNIVVQINEFFYGSYNSSTATSWAQSELSLVNQNLSTQPMGLYPLTAPTLPAATPGTCASATDCLVPLPSGATDTTAASYDGTVALDASTYSTQYDGYSGTDIGAWLNTDGFTSGEHQSYTASNGATDDVALLKFSTPAQAQAATLFNYGATAADDRVCTDAAVPDSICLATAVSTTDPLQKETIWVLAWKGDYEVSVSVTVSNQADITDAYTLAQQQLALLPAS